MGILRSERMQHGTLVIPSDRAVEIVTLLGTQGCLQVQDMNHITMRRPYRRYIQRIEEMERMLRYLVEEINKLPGAAIETGNYQDFLQHDNFVLDGVEDSLQTLYAQFVKFRENNDDLLKQRNRAQMEQAVARVAMKSLQSSRLQSAIKTDTQGGASSQSLLQGDAEVGGAQVAGFSSFAGVVLQQDQEKLSRTLFRATRGNAYTHIEDLEEDLVDPATGQPQARNVFVVYYQGGPGSALHEKISRICQAFGIETFEWPKSAEEASQKVSQLQELIDDKTRALEAFEEFFFDEIAVLLEPVRPGGNSLIEDWRLFCQKQKAIYACLNLFEETDATLRAECWYPAEEEDQIRNLLANFSGPNQVSAFLLGDRTALRKNPPTYIKTTAFTESFQNIVDTYGVPRYQEANPALLTIVTFPFLFGVMYGDIGHGGLVLLFAIFLCFAYPKLSKSSGEMLQMILYGRYLILLMGCFAVYSGFIYNDFFSLGVDVFGSRYKPLASSGKVIEFAKDENKDFPYPFGFDPIWKGADNELDFMNSFKMKFSVIVAFVQMTTGIILKAFNSVHYKDYLTLWFEFIPQLLFMLALIGYMDFLIFFKWASNHENNQGPNASIISTVIGMCMLRSVEAKDEFFSNQRTVQVALLAVMLVSIPWMLLPKPLLELMAHKRGQASKPSHRNAGADPNEEAQPLGELDRASTGVDDEEEEPFEFGEIMIHQMIETIEFVLGVVSNTASYLRLWALSLAHQQLALVFFENIILQVLESLTKPDGNIIAPGIAMFLAFGAFAAITFGIMLCMDSLECFLHALRLQWVEFQNKFYKADGYKFIPFSFFRIISGADVD
eukprot:Gregarina_sp_Pseudo_9__1767@NODE_21_length_5816_cov_43_641856_g19_i0_p1_GENE_NODE_21_length_5816_cov_43_641856_g19_i0NODE_21_length_5816_cov_43_641856_g19_i0_p1_ORF_typecomplete_len837_score202_96V_ATPase_I/PF01496_19/9_8e56DUF3611/PF12263_8/53DUF3611/PF12263_8/19DUF3611/PF12263_8/14Complex1_49kDa/PF00346_19/0_18_NODE_21_length_5816_cov_43_641856_g19_i014733983